MHGNVQEWTSAITLRGGSWHSKAAGVRAAVRQQTNRQATKSNETGFRLVLRFKEQK